MQEDVTTPPPPAPPAPEQRRSPVKRFFFVLLLLLGAFLGGYVPSTWRARAMETTLHTTKLDLRLANLHRRLGVAAEEAQRNNYATATAAAREFFDGCGAVAQSGSLASQPRTQIAIAAYAAQRDEIKTALAGANPGVRERLAGMYLAMDGVLARKQ